MQGPGTLRLFFAYQPSHGIQASSFFITKAEPGSQANWAKTSSMHWCLGATSAAPLGIYCWPRSSTRMPQTGSMPTTPRPQKLNIASVHRAGPSSSGVASTATTAVHR